MIPESLLRFGSECASRHEETLDPHPRGGIDDHPSHPVAPTHVGADHPDPPPKAAVPGELG
jgi:hypothetical protein